MSVRLAIIGTAGRGDDYSKLTQRHFWEMTRAAERVLSHLAPDHTRLVSGGAAWADHVAVYLSLARQWEAPLSLHLPGLASDKAVAMKYHYRFSRIMGIDSFQMIQEIRNSLWCMATELGSFKQRNARVADEATHFLAMTFGQAGRVKDGAGRKRNGQPHLAC